MSAQPHSSTHRSATAAALARLLLLCAALLLLGGAPRPLQAAGLFGLVGVPSVDIEGYGWLGDLYLEHTLKVLSTSDEQPEPQINAVFVEDALWILSGQLQQQGYLYPTISARVSNEEGEVIYEGTWGGQELTPHLPTSLEGAHILFSIEAGLLFYFDSITIQGLPADLKAIPESFFYPTDQLLSFKSTRYFNRSRGVGGVQAILARLRAMGYRDAEASDPIVNINRATGAVSFFAEIEHGAIYYADERIIEPDSPASAAQVLEDIPLFLHLADTPRLTPEWLQSQLQQIRNRYYEHGYPEVRLFVHYEDVTDPHAELSPAIDAKPNASANIDNQLQGTFPAGAALPFGSHSAPPSGTAPITINNTLFAVDLADNITPPGRMNAAPTANAATGENWADATVVTQTPTFATTQTPTFAPNPIVAPATTTTTTLAPAGTSRTTGATQPTLSEIINSSAAHAPRQTPVEASAPTSIRQTAAAPVAANTGSRFDPASTTAALIAAEAHTQATPASLIDATAQNDAPPQNETTAAALPIVSGTAPIVSSIQTEADATAHRNTTTTAGSTATAASDTITPAGSTTTLASATTTADHLAAAMPSATATTTTAANAAAALSNADTAENAARSAAVTPAAIRTRGQTPPGTRYQRVIIKVQSGPQVKIGKINFSGEYGTSQTVLQSQLTIAPGQKLDRNSVEITRNKLSSLGIFRSVEIDYTEVDENTWDITYNMQMKQRTEISLIAGVGSFDIIRGGFLIEQNNLFGLAHSQRLRAVQSFKATDISYRYGIPQIFGNDIDFYAKGTYLYRQEISFNRQEYGAATGIQRYYRPLRTTFDLQYSLEQLSARNRSFLVPPGPTQATVSAITLKASHNGLDNPIFPTRGWQAHLSAEFAVKDLGGQVEYQRMEMAIAYHVPLTDSGLIFHTGLRHGVITTTGTAIEEIPVNRRFFMGGENTVRGYRRDQASPRDAQGNQIGAVSYVLWQVELEQRLTEDFSVVTFLDALGNAADISQYPFNETVASIGLGINYRTFVGPLRLEYGYNIKKRTGDPSGTVQVSIGFPF